MNPTDYYRMKSAEIKEADIRLVAACMSEHVGEGNAVRMSCERAGASSNRLTCRRSWSLRTERRNWDCSDE